MRLLRAIFLLAFGLGGLALAQTTTTTFPNPPVTANKLKFGAAILTNSSTAPTLGQCYARGANNTTVGVDCSSNTGADALGSYLVQTATHAPVNSQAMGALATGIVKNATTTGVQSIAVSNTDFASPAATYICKTSTSCPSSGQVMASLGTGLVKNTTTTGVQSIGVANTDYAHPSATYLCQTSSNCPSSGQAMGALATGLVKNATTTGVQSIGVANTDFAHPSATYITQTSTNAPTNSQNLAALATGALCNTTGTGVLSICASTVAAAGWVATYAANAATSMNVSGSTFGIVFDDFVFGATLGTNASNTRWESAATSTVAYDKTIAGGVIKLTATVGTVLMTPGCILGTSHTAPFDFKWDGKLSTLVTGTGTQYVGFRSGNVAGVGGDAAIVRYIPADSANFKADFYGLSIAGPAADTSPHQHHVWSNGTTFHYQVDLGTDNTAAASGASDASACMFGYMSTAPGNGATGVMLVDRFFATTPPAFTYPSPYP